jgi:hypothetical protein
MLGTIARHRPVIIGRYYEPTLPITYQAMRKLINELQQPTLLQSRVLGLGLHQDWHIRVGVFPQR